MVGTLILTRHGQSDWNKQNLFTGWKDPALTELGEQEAKKGGEELKKAGFTHFDVAFTSDLQRAQRTLQIMLQVVGQENVPTTKDQALNERDYGELTGLNKDSAREKWGDEQVHIWRRSFDVPPPNGESLKLTADRVLPYFNKHIMPLVKEGKTVIVSAHGNSLRAAIMQLENLSGDQIVKTELGTGVPMVYKIDESGKVTEKKILE